MPERDREQAVDRLLRGAMKRSPGSTPTCLDAESIAAWMSGTLAPVEAARAERHVADCARCQAVAATLVRITPDEPLPVSAWSRWRLAWLVPVATAATAAALWLSLPGRGPVPLAPDPAASTVARQDSSAAALEAAPGDTVPAAPTAGPSASAEARAADMPVETLAGRLNAEPERQRADERPGPDPVRPQARPPAAPAEADFARESVAKRVGDVRQEAAAAPAAPDPATNELSRRAFASALAEPLVIVSIDQTWRWRITSGQQVEWSSSGGASWDQVALAPPDPLTAGSAPSSAICWLVGQRGAVYLTIDGTRFVRLAFPEAVDLVSVAAVNERTATVTSADGRTWSTSDQGRSWSRK